MHLELYDLLLFLLSFAGGVAALLWYRPSEQSMQHLLAFSGSFLLTITFLHLLPESFTRLSPNSGYYLLLGFFIQLLIQRLTHGVEHGHLHAHHVRLAPLIAGLSVHALMEGVPLGFHYSDPATPVSLYLAVAVHKIPEAILLAGLVRSVKGTGPGWIVAFCFALLTPISAVGSRMAGERYLRMAQLISVIIPIVAGAFIHISTTIFFESGTRQHTLSWPKILAMLFGVGVGTATLLLES